MKLKCKSFAWGGIYILSSRSVLCMFWRYPRWCKQPISFRVKTLQNNQVHSLQYCTNILRQTLDARVLLPQKQFNHPAAGPSVIWTSKLCAKCVAPVLFAFSHIMSLFHPFSSFSGLSSYNIAFSDMREPKRYIWSK